MSTKTKDLSHLLAQTIVAQKALDTRRRAIVRELNGRHRALALVSDALASHDLEGTALPLDGADSLKPEVLSLIENPLAGL
jgi:hypothetical protein